MSKEAEMIPEPETSQSLSQPTDSFQSTYKSNIAPRQTVISRRTTNEHCQSLVSMAMTQHPISLRPSGMALRDTRQKEKQQMCELNDRFASYVERVRFLEAQNKKLQMELTLLKSKWGCETKQIEKMYQIELEEARSVLNETSKMKDCLQLKLDKTDRELEGIRTKYCDLEKYMVNERSKMVGLQDQIVSNESEIGLLKRRLSDLQDEEKRVKQETNRMKSEVQRVANDLEIEMKQRLMLENDKQMLEEELLFLKEIHAKELEEIKQLALKDSGIDPAQYFKDELATAIREIRVEYETLNQFQRTELERWYKVKVIEIFFF